MLKGLDTGFPQRGSETSGGLGVDLWADASGALRARMSSEGGWPSMAASAASCALCASASLMRASASRCRRFSLSSSLCRCRFASLSCGRRHTDVQDVATGCLVFCRPQSHFFGSCASVTSHGSSATAAVGLEVVRIALDALAETLLTLAATLPCAGGKAQQQEWSRREEEAGSQEANLLLPDGSRGISPRHQLQQAPPALAPALEHEPGQPHERLGP